MRCEKFKQSYFTTSEFLQQKWLQSYAQRQLIKSDKKVCLVKLEEEIWTNTVGLIGLRIG